MKVLLFTALIASSYIYTDAALTWSDCSDAGTNKAVTVNSIDLDPTTVVFPGTEFASLNLTVNRLITHIFVDVELFKITTFGKSKIPCIAGTNIGSCSNIDGCQIIEDILNGSTPVSVALGKQLVAILTEATGHTPQCPIPMESVVFTHKSLTLGAIPSTTGFSSIVNGNYTMKIMIKDDPTSTANVGCLQINVGVGKKGGEVHHGFLFD